jgi:HEAT repeat protein
MSLFRRGPRFFARARAWILIAGPAFFCASPVFSQALSTSAVQQRIEAIQASIRSRDLSATGRLIAAFDAEPAPSVRAWIVNALSALDPAQGLALFEKSLSDPEAEVRGAGVRALGALGGPRAAADLTAALAVEKAAGVRHALAFWLGTFKGDSSVEALDKALGADPNPNVRVQAASSLKWIGTEKARKRLKKAESDPDERVRRISHE